MDYFLPTGGSNGSDYETPFNDNASVISNASSGSFMRDEVVTSGDDTTEELSQVERHLFNLLTILTSMQ